MGGVIKKVAVFGSGVMGSAIAAHIANSGTEVLLFDIVKEGSKDRNQLAKDAIARMLKSEPAPFTSQERAKLVTPCNIEDDLNRLSDVDWIIEAVLENLQIKQDLYKKLETHKKKDAIISSNTSTIPLSHLLDGFSDSFRQNFLITHFFNPPRYMRLLELVKGQDTSKQVVETIRDFADIKLGKGIVDCNDTPGFIANRIGVYWLNAALNDAINMGVTVEEADLVMGRPVGIPKTGVFGLMDLIGIDLMPMIAKEMFDTLDKEDAFRKEYNLPELVKNMIEEGYTGRKGKGGFYRLERDGEKKVKQAKDLKTGEYKKAGKPSFASIDAARLGLANMVETDDLGAKYAWSVLSKTLTYAASLVPEIADNIYAVDRAMKLGYNWKYGPFELIDRFADKEKSGPEYFVARLAKEGNSVPKLLQQVENSSLYTESEGGSRQFFDLSGKFKDIIINPDAFMLIDKKRGKTPILKNPSAKLWDIGDGVACIEYTSKMNSVDPMILEMLQKAVDMVKKDFKALIIANDSDNFCVGANIGILLFAANVAAWKQIHDIIKQGQDTYMALKYAPFPVVGAATGMALGGGCEVLLHCDAVQAHIETYSGLVEVGVGIIPGWGGCKEMLLRQMEKRQKDERIIAKMGRMFSAVGMIRSLNSMPAISKSFEYIALAKVAKSAEEAKEMLILDDRCGLTMNRERLLCDAKNLSLNLAKNYQPKNKDDIKIRLPGKTARAALQMAIKGFVKSGKATKHDEVVSNALAYTLSGGNTDITKELSEQDLLDLERESFMELVKTKATLARLEHMLEVGKPLRN